MEKKKGKRMSRNDVLNQIFTQHLLGLLAVYNETAGRLAEIKEKDEKKFNK